MRQFVIAVAIFCWSLPASASSRREGFRYLINLGPWIGSLHQSDSNGHEVDVGSSIGLGLGIQAGANFGPAFLEYNASILMPGNSLRLREQPPGAKDADYMSWFGVNFGFIPPTVPIEPFVGLEWGSYGLSAGSQTDFEGKAVKVGVSFYFSDSFGLRGEYRKLFIAGDDTGFLPEGIEADASSYMISLTFGRR
jgi:hypothetical protein